ncbi:hypothetical protein JCM5350_003377 [Sporobolomyces pararoseus]
MQVQTNDNAQQQRQEGEGGGGDDQPQPPQSKPSLFLTSTTTTGQDSTTESRATSPDLVGGGGQEIDQLMSSDDEQQPQQGPGPQPTTTIGGQATSQGGAIAGPGPSTSLKRSSPPPPTPSVAPAPPTKKPRGRKAIPLNQNHYNPPPFPHYSVQKCSGTNSKQNRHVLKINQDVTDGTKMKWPIEREFESTNKENGKAYWYEKQIKSVGRHRAQLERIGDTLAQQLKLYDPEVTTEYWILDEFPKNYIFTIHHCFTGSNQPRTDPYVFGCPMTAKFRSANEIIPHLFWLISHGPGKHSKCACKYCSKKTQSEVNKIEGLSDGKSRSIPVIIPPPAPRGRPPRINNNNNVDKKPDLEKKPRPTTTKSKSPQTTTTNKPLIRSRTFNSSSPEPSYSGAFVDKQRDSDLLTGAKFRRGEMVWVKVYPQESLMFSTKSVSDPSEFKVCVTHWPAIVENREERTESFLKKNNTDEEEEGGGEGDYVVGSGKIPNFENRKRFVYDIVYLGTQSKAQTVEQDEIKAWLEIGSPDNVWKPERLLDPETVKLVWNGSKIVKVDLEEIENLEQAVAPLALAMQIAAHTMSTFSVVDRYIIKDGHFVLPPRRTQVREQSEGSEGSTESLKEDEGGVSEEILQQMTIAKSNWFYQSLYFGSELIWINEFVRIIHSPKQSLPPHHELSKGSNEKSLFMQLQAIWKDQESGQVKLTGQLYELRDLMINNEGAGTGSIGAGIGGLGAMSIFEKKSPHSGGTGGGASPGARSMSNGVGGGGGGDSVVDETSTPPQTNSSSQAFYSIPLPPAPEGFEFNRLTPGESQITMSLDYLGGRYYPLPKRFNSRSKIDEILASYPHDSDDDEDEMEQQREKKKKVDVQLTDADRAIALAGLVPAYGLYCKATRWKGDRATALVDAEVSACQEVGQYFEQAL